MDEYDIELESIAPEEFDLENFESQVQSELHRLSLRPLVQGSSQPGGNMSPPDNVPSPKVQESSELDNLPPPKMSLPPKRIASRSRVLSYIRNFFLNVVIFIFIGVILGFLLARGTSINLATIAITIYGIGFVLGLFFLLRFFLGYREREVRKARQAIRERQQAEEAAKRRISQLVAQETLNNPSIRRLLCPSLKSVTSDVFEISKVVTPVLTGAVIAGTIAIPLNPLLFAAIAVVIARSGVNSLCADFK
jgi:uncharacterized membrane protein YciS (DUF1049 family)